MSAIWHNGIFKNDEAVLEASDRLRLGDGVFDTMLAVNGKPVFAAQHFQRLMFHASIFGIHYDILPEVFEDAAREILQRAGKVQGRAIIRTLLTRGPSAKALQIPDNPKPQMIMRVSEPGAINGPVSIIIAQNVRRNEGSPLSRIKSVNYGDHILALQEARARGGDDAILLNNKGRVTCASAGNIFVVLNGQLVTPPLEDGVMGGIMRRLVIEKCGAAERSLVPEELMLSDGVYITNCVRGAFVVASIDGKDVKVPQVEIDPKIHLG